MDKVSYFNDKTITMEMDINPLNPSGFPTLFVTNMETKNWKNGYFVIYI
jgi:hypothetical protein